MDCIKVGKLICKLRKEKGFTQKSLGDMLLVSDRTISKWERGVGCPDISLLSQLSKILGVNIEKLLRGNLQPNDLDGGNMKKLKFYVCPSCNNILCETGESQISCCGRLMVPLTAQTADVSHSPKVEEIENDYYITLPHEMHKHHYIAFIAYVSWDRVLLMRLYLEQNAEVRFPKMSKGLLYSYCSQHGLWKIPL